MLDKPAGCSSNDALHRAKRFLNARKAGHTGTLDPFATGLLPLCFGEATKFSQDLLDADKTYRAELHLGLTTSTGDTEGDVLVRRDVTVSMAQLEAALGDFRGRIEQVPPMYSALKRDGKPLYAYAREGVTLDRAPRSITIHRLELVDWQAPYATLEVCCSKGTYVRVLGEDIGKVLGCGAHLRALRRTAVGLLDIRDATTLDVLEALPEPKRVDCLKPVDSLLSSFPEVRLTALLAERFLHGQRLPLHNSDVLLPDAAGRVKVIRDADGVLLGTAQLAPYGVLAPERLIALGPR